MTQSQPASPRAAPPLLHATLLGSLGILLLATAFRDFRIAQEHEFLRTNVLVSEIVAGVGAAICFGGSIHFVNDALSTPLRWFQRFPLLANTRILMLLQIAAMAIAVGAAGLILFNERIPGPDYTVLYEGWSPPPVPD